MLTDGNRIPLAVVVDGANRNDDKLLAATLDGIVLARPASSSSSSSSSEEEEEAAEHLCLDAGYDSKAVREEVELRRGYEALTSVLATGRSEARRTRSITQERRPAVR